MWIVELMICSLQWHTEIDHSNEKAKRSGLNARIINSVYGRSKRLLGCQWFLLCFCNPQSNRDQRRKFYFLCYRFLLHLKREAMLAAALRCSTIQWVFHDWHLQCLSSSQRLRLRNKLITIFRFTIYFVKVTWRCHFKHCRRRQRREYISH